MQRNDNEKILSPLKEFGYSEVTEQHGNIYNNLIKTVPEESKKNSVCLNSMFAYQSTIKKCAQTFKGISSAAERYDGYDPCINSAWDSETYECSKKFDELLIETVKQCFSKL